MNKTELALAASAVTICVLGYKLHNRTRQLKNLQTSFNKLVEWSTIAQDVLKETRHIHPEFIGQLSEKLNTHIQFYNIMTEEDLT